MDARFWFLEGFLLNVIIFIILAALVRLIRDTTEFEIYRWQKLLAFALLFVPFSYVVAVLISGIGYGVQQLAKTVWEFFAT